MTAYLDILYHDDHLIVLNKPAGLLSVPGRLPEHKDSLALRLMRVLPEAHVVHRLDMATSGLILMAGNKEALRQLSRQFQARTVQKRYLARVFGSVVEDEGSVELPLICDWDNRPRQKVCFTDGKPALTHWRVLARDGQATRVALMPVTGRSHQLRVHMAALGHPILGDQFYAKGAALAASSRLELHAEFIAFTHPHNGAALEFHCPAPF